MQYRCYRCRHKKGSVIDDRLEGIPCVVLIESGEIAVHVSGLDGKRTHLSTLSPGECFGISNLLSERELDTQLRCKTAATAIYIPKSLITNAMRQNPELAMRYAAHCNEKINFLIGRIEALTLQSASAKLASYLLRHQDNDNKHTLTTTRERFASYLGISRAALYREFSLLEEMGAIELSGRSIYIKDDETLKNIINKS